MPDSSDVIAIKGNKPFNELLKELISTIKEAEPNDSNDKAKIEIEIKEVVVKNVTLRYTPSS